MDTSTFKGDPTFEATLKRAAATPGPADYDVPSGLSQSGGRFAFEFDPSLFDTDSESEYGD